MRKGRDNEGEMGGDYNDVVLVSEETKCWSLLGFGPIQSTSVPWIWAPQAQTQGALVLGS